MSSFMIRTSSSFSTTTATVVIAAAFSVAAAVIFALPSVSHFAASSFPMIYDNTVYFLKPPCLYLVINCIIVSIVATSKLTKKPSSVSDDDSDHFHKVVTPVTVENDPTVEDLWNFPEVTADDKVTGDDQKETDKSCDSPPILKHTRKPPRLGQQKSLSFNNSEGGGNKKSTLGVTKLPKRQDTMETTWKKITEGRSTPLTRHLTKSDTWQERTHVQSEKKKMTKSANMTDGNAPKKEETRLKREASPGQEELNRRVEAFIQKFNEEMRLQRLESLAKSNNDMVNAGTAL